MEKKIRKKKGEEGRKIGLKVQQKKTYQTEFFFFVVGLLLEEMLQTTQMEQLIIYNAWVFHN